MKIFDFDKFLDTFTGYIETKLELFKLDIKEEISALLAKAVVYISISLLGVVALTFALTALASWFNELLGSRYLGYLLVCVIILLIAAFVFAKRASFQENILRRLEDQDSTSQENE